MTTVYEEQEHIYAHEDYTPCVDDSNSGGSSFLFTFLKSLRIGSDLTKMSTPVNIEKGRSGLETNCDIMRPTEEIITIAKTQSAEQRMLKVLKYLLAPMSGIPRPSLAKAEKPYNPLLGEEFHCLWNHSDDSQTIAVCEQISHHPPINALYMFNQHNNFAVECTSKGAPSFLGNKLEIRSVGYNAFHVFLEDASSPDGIKETYVFDKPALVARGLFIGKACFEISQSLKITCERTGYAATIEFKSGNIVKGEVTESYEEQKKSKSKTKSRAIYILEGSIVGQIMITDVRTKQKELFIDTFALNDMYKVVKPVVKQEDMESRKVWHHVTYAIKNKDLETAGKLKAEIEEQQRQRIKEMKSEYQPKYFRKTSKVVDKVDVYEYIHPLTKYHRPELDAKIVDELD